MRRISRILALVLTAVAVAGAGLTAAAPAGAAATAHLVAAAPLGTVRPSATSGTVDATPIFATALTSRPCPAGFGADAQLRVGQPGGPYSNLATPLRAGGYDRAPVTARPNRSFATALGGPPADGEWWIVVECVSRTEGVHPDRFITEITVSGGRWRVGRPANAPPPAGATTAGATPGGAALSTAGRRPTPAPRRTSRPVRPASGSPGASGRARRRSAARRGCSRCLGCSSSSAWCTWRRARDTSPTGPARTRLVAVSASRPWPIAGRALTVCSPPARLAWVLNTVPGHRSSAG